MSTSTTAPDHSPEHVADPPTAPPPSEARRALSGLWPLAAAGAGLTSFVFTSFISRFLTDAETEGGVAAVYAAVEDDGVRTHVGVVAAFLCVAFLAVFAADFGRFLAARAPQGSLAAQVARLGVAASVATVALAASLKAIYRGGLPDHGDAGMYTEQAVVTFQILVDQYQWAAYWTLALAMGAVVVLGLGGQGPAAVVRLAVGRADRLRGRHDRGARPAVLRRRRRPGVAGRHHGRPAPHADAPGLTRASAPGPARGDRGARRARPTAASAARTA